MKRFNIPIKGKKVYALLRKAKVDIEFLDETHLTVEKSHKLKQE